jgi:hypothetical protein
LGKKSTNMNTALYGTGLATQSTHRKNCRMKKLMRKKARRKKLGERSKLVTTIPLGKKETAFLGANLKTAATIIATPAPGVQKLTDIQEIMAKQAPTTTKRNYVQASSEGKTALVTVVASNYAIVSTKNPMMTTSSGGRTYEKTTEKTRLNVGSNDKANGSATAAAKSASSAALTYLSSSSAVKSASSSISSNSSSYSAAPLSNSKSSSSYSSAAIPSSSLDEDNATKTEVKPSVTNKHQLTNQEN